MIPADEIKDLRDRVEALEREALAYSVLFRGLMEAFGPGFVELAQAVGELVEANPQARGPVSQRMTEALRIIEDLRRYTDSKPKPGNVV